MADNHNSDSTYTVNSPKRRLTVDDVRKEPGLENLSDAEAEETLDTIYKLAAILFEIHCSENSICIENQQVVYLDQQNRAA